MSGRIDFDASVEARSCCFCGKPLVNISEQTEKQSGNEAEVWDESQAFRLY